jgi:exodeoxyribonuclease III
MQIATWNVNSIRTRQQIVTDWLQQNPVDVLCLQETKVRDEHFPLTPFSELGYQVYFSGQKAYNGVAIFSKKPLSEVNYGFSPVLGSEIVGEFDEQKRVIAGVVDNIQIVNLYVPNGSAIGSEKYEYKLAWLTLLKKYLQTLQTQQPREICICGDFNIALEDRDIYNPQGKAKHIMASVAERNALQEVLTVGLQDAFRKFTTETGYYSWWDYRAAGFQRDRGWRIDSHYLTPQLYQQASKCWIDIEPRKLPQPSDHAPVILEIEQ